MRALSNSQTYRGSSRHHKTAAEHDALIVQQHELDRFRSPSKRAVEVNISSKTVRHIISEILSIQFYYQTKPILSRLL